MTIGPYTFYVYYQGFDRKFDDQLEDIIGKAAWSSGYGFGERDLSFDFPTEEAAIAAREKLDDMDLKIEIGDITYTPQFDD